MATKSKKAAAKLSYKDQRELDSLPQQIEQLETEISQVSERISQPDFYKAERSETEQTENHLSELQKQLSHCYDRWELLEAE